MTLRGMTRARTLGPIAALIDEHGGRASRVFNEAELPLDLHLEPDAFVPLKDHFRLLALAGRELKDEHFGARLGQTVTMTNLGAYGQWVTAAPTLLDAIRRANRSLRFMLQSATDLRLHFEGRHVRWSYCARDSAAEGRQQNLILAFFHMFEMVRAFAGPGWRPDRVIIPGSPPMARSELAQLVDAPVSYSEDVGGVVFDRRLLSLPATRRRRTGLKVDELEQALDVPEPDDLDGTVTALIELQMLDSIPNIDWVARKLSISTRSLQRRLADRGARFSDLVQAALERRAIALLLSGEYSITQIAMSLGYSDAAHFSRAFKHWTGMSPRAWIEIADR